MNVLHNRRRNVIKLGKSKNLRPSLLHSFRCSCQIMKAITHLYCLIASLHLRFMWHDLDTHRSAWICSIFQHCLGSWRRAWGQAYVEICMLSISASLGEACNVSFLCTFTIKKFCEKVGCACACAVLLRSNILFWRLSGLGFLWIKGVLVSCCQSHSSKRLQFCSRLGAINSCN